MSPEELDAYGRLAEQISAFVQGCAEYGQGEHLSSPYFDSMSTSTLEAIAGAAIRLGILSPVAGNPAIFSYALNHEAVYLHAVSIAEGGPQFDELLTDFIYCCLFHGGGFRTYAPTQGFPVCIEFDGLFRSLAAIGYVTKAGREYAWTMKAAPAMGNVRSWPHGSRPGGLK